MVSISRAAGDREQRASIAGDRLEGARTLHRSHYPNLDFFVRRQFFGLQEKVQLVALNMQRETARYALLQEDEFLDAAQHYKSAAKRRFVNTAAKNGEGHSCNVHFLNSKKTKRIFLDRKMLFCFPRKPSMLCIISEKIW